MKGTIGKSDHGTIRPSLPIRPCRTRRLGLTLVELVIALSVGALVAAAALAALSSTFSSWSRLAAGGTLSETHRALFLLERDVASAHPLPDEPLTGDEASLSFPMERDNTLRIVSWTAEDARLIRREHPYRFGKEEPVADDTLSQSFRLPASASFGYLPEETAEPLDAFTADCATNLPASVRVTVGDYSRLCPFRLATRSSLASHAQPKQMSNRFALDGTSRTP